VGREETKGSASLTTVQCSSALQVPCVIPQVCDSAIRLPVQLRRLNNYSGLSCTHTQKYNSGDEDFKMNPTYLQSVLSAMLREQEQRNAAVLREQEQHFVQLLDALRVDHSTSAAVAPPTQGNSPLPQLSNIESFVVDAENLTHFDDWLRRFEISLLCAAPNIVKRRRPWC